MNVKHKLNQLLAGERFNVAADQPEVIADIQREAENSLAALVPGERQY